MASYIHNRKTGDGGMAAVAIVLVSLDEEAGNAASDSLDEILFNTVAGGDLVFRLEPCVWMLIVNASCQEPQSTADRVRDAWLQSYCGRANGLPKSWSKSKHIYHIPSEDDKTPMSTDDQHFPRSSRTQQAVHTAGRRRPIDHRTRSGFGCPFPGTTC